MKKLLQALLVLLPFVTTSVIAAPAQKNTVTKQTAKQTKKTMDKKAIVKKSAEKKAQNTKQAVKKSVEKKVSKKEKAVENKTKKMTSSKTDKKQAVQTKKSPRKVETPKTTKAVKKSEKANPAKSKAVEKSVKVEEKKIEKAESNTPKAAPLSDAKKMVVVPKCQDKQVFKVLSDAFKQQGNATGAQMTVKQINQVRETQHYPQQGIRSCHALVETSGKKYQTDYSVILNGNGFFVQVENAQAMF